ncbi:hypothetical protein XELAEV_18034931mg [Xenopus laevis]|uniref:Uncharacterized protein n=1 Tax=Xenopus laevis TaxID=8355 RepID=A0A974CET1_XENLA|nr:hypothetical protein XELAEV_18034931mg [Xenopus laevis]
MLLHILWECAEIQTFWEKTIDICNTELQLTIPKDLANILLDHNVYFVPTYKKSLMQYALNAWKSSTIPTIAEWTLEMEDISKFEDLHAESTKAKRNYWATWRPWLMYIETTQGGTYCNKGNANM